MEERKAKNLRREAEKAGLRPGRTIETMNTTEYGSDEAARRKSRRGTVLQLFQHMFLCDMGRYKECFRYNEFLGNEIGKKVRLRGL